MSAALASKYDTYDNVDRTSYTSASVSPTANAPLYVVIINYGTSTVPTVSATGYTFTQRQTVANGTRVITLFSAAGISSPGSITVTASFGTSTQTGCEITILEGSGIDATTNDGIVQSATATGSATSGSVTLTVTSGNLTVLSVSHAANESTSSSNMGTALSSTSGTTPSQSGATFTSLSVNNPQGNWTTSSSYLMIGWELKSSAAASYGPQLMLLGVG